MLLVILGIGLVILTCGIIVYIKDEHTYENESVYLTLNIIGGIVVFVSLIATIVVGAKVSKSMVIEDTIQLYQSENQEIENQIKILADDYMKYESETFEKYKIEDSDAITIVSLFPELKTNMIIGKQIEVYVSNKEQIKELKAEKLSYKVYKWWLYFGNE